MKFNEAISILKLLGTRHEDAMTVQQIMAKWNAVHTEELPLRTAQRYMSELAADGADGGALVEVDDSKKVRRYHLRLSEMANWLMTEEAALYQWLSLQVLQSTFGDAASRAIERQLDAAEHLTQEQLRTRRLRNRVRIVPDGIGRLRARIPSEVLASSMDALAGDQQLSVEYLSAGGKSSSLVLHPLGLVAKDGTIYLLAVKGLEDRPFHYPLQRVRSASVRPLPAQGRADFHLDEYIRATHQLSHPLEPQSEPQKVRLKVDPKWLYHFEERPLSGNQTIERAAEPGQRPIVTAVIPVSILLKPFIMSYGPGIEVLEPASLRQEVAQWLTEAAATYRPPADHS